MHAAYHRHGTEGTTLARRFDVLPAASLQRLLDVTAFPRRVIRRRRCLLSFVSWSQADVCYRLHDKSFVNKDELLGHQDRLWRHPSLKLRDTHRFLDWGCKKGLTIPDFSRTKTFFISSWLSESIWGLFVYISSTKKSPNTHILYTIQCNMCSRKWSVKICWNIFFEFRSSFPFGNRTVIWGGLFIKIWGFCGPKRYILK